MVSSRLPLLPLADRGRSNPGVDRERRSFDCFGPHFRLATPRLSAPTSTWPSAPPARPTAYRRPAGALPAPTAGPAAAHPAGPAYRPPPAGTAPARRGGD